MRAVKKRGKKDWVSVSRDQVFMYAEGWDGATVPRWLILFNYLKNVWKNLLYLCCSSFFKKKKKKRNGKGSYSNKDKYSIIQTPNILFRFIIVLAQNIKWFKRLRSWCLHSVARLGEYCCDHFFTPNTLWFGMEKESVSAVYSAERLNRPVAVHLIFCDPVPIVLALDEPPVYILRFKQFHQRVHFSLHRFWC